MGRAGWSFALLLSMALLVGCGGDDAGSGMQIPATDAGTRPDSGGGSAPVTESAQFLKEYASAVCAMYEPCCEAQSLGYDADGCTTWFSKVTAAYLRGTFRADKARACLAGVEEAFAADPDRCANVVVFDEATLRATCEEAFGPAMRAGQPLGGKCTSASECASTPDQDGSIICYAHTCVLERNGRAGDGPCYIGGNSGVEGVPDVVIKCDAAAGLYCDRENNICAQHVEPGAYCPFANACGPDALCTGGRCVALPAQGERCANAVPGAGGFCRAGSACDPASLMCGPPLAEGAVCREPAQCATGSCMNGHCTKLDFTRNLNCTGG